MKGIGYIRQYQLDEINVTVAWKNVRNVSLRVVPPHGEVRMSVPLGCPEKDVLRILDDRREWIANAVYRVEKRAEAVPKEHDVAMLRAWIEDFKPLFEQWEQRMGLNAAKVSFKMMKSRWGSCRSSTRALTFNLMLAYKPQECVEYVIIHELAHIVHPNHSKEFWSLVGRYCPDYHRLRRLLNDH